MRFKLSLNFVERFQSMTWDGDCATGLSNCRPTLTPCDFKGQSASKRNISIDRVKRYG